jgi:hypothetical protein
MFFCAPPKARPMRDQSIGRLSWLDEQSTTRGASQPSGRKSGKSWNSTPSMVSLLHRCR